MLHKGRGLRLVQERRTRNSMKKQTPFLHEQIESPNTSLQEIELNPSCSGQAHFNRPGTGHGYESTRPEGIVTVLCAPSIINSLGSADA